MPQPDKHFAPEKVFVPISDDYVFEHPEVFLSGELEPFSPLEDVYVDDSNIIES